MLDFKIFYGKVSNEKGVLFVNHDNVNSYIIIV
jgi:hypothetical protein